MQSAALYCTDLAMRRAIQLQQRDLNRGFWIVHAAIQSVFLTAMLSALFQIVNSFRGTSGDRESILLSVLLDLGSAMQRIPIGLSLAILLFAAHSWLNNRRNAMLADSHSTRLELLNYLSRLRC